MLSEQLLKSLAKAVVYWLEYESLCGRTEFLSESSLKTPLFDFLVSRSVGTMLIEEEYPGTYQPSRGRRRSADFCLKRKGGQVVWTAIAEAKFLKGSRDYSQEIFDDLVRLESVRRAQKESFQRLFIVAGKRTSIQSGVFERQVNVGNGPRCKLFKDVLPDSVGTCINVDVHRAANGIYPYWKEAALAFGLPELPLTMTIRMLAREIGHDEYECILWRVSSSRKRSTRPLR